MKGGGGIKKLPSKTPALLRLKNPKVFTHQLKEKLCTHELKITRTLPQAIGVLI